MPFLGTSASPFDEVIEKATNEVNTSENWSLIMDICDKITQGDGKGARDGLLSIKKRLNHRDPHVVMLALSVLDSCWSNCGPIFRREVCSREFIGELRSKATGSNLKVGEKTRSLIKKWSEEEAKSDPSLGLIPSLYAELKKDDYSFESSDPPKKSVKFTNDPNYTSTKEEEDAIAKAIQMSLNEKKSEKGGRKEGGGSTASSLYPTQLTSQPPSRTVKALYDFEAAEDNELTFKAGEIINILDDSDMNWWKGSNYRGEGLFPASFVTADLTAPIELNENPNAEPVKSEPTEEEAEELSEPIKIDEEKLALCLQLLEDADPTGERPDDPQLKPIEEQCLAMGPLIDNELTEVDRQHNLLAEVDVKIRDALNLYNQAMNEANAHYQAQMQQAMAAAAAQSSGIQQVPNYQQGMMVYSQVPTMGGEQASRSEQDLSASFQHYPPPSQPQHNPYPQPPMYQPSLPGQSFQQPSGYVQYHS